MAGPRVRHRGGPGRGGAQPHKAGPVYRCDRIKRTLRNLFGSEGRPGKAHHLFHPRILHGGGGSIVGFAPGLGEQFQLGDAL